MNMQFLTRLDLSSQLPLEEILTIMTHLANNISNDNSDEPSTTISSTCSSIKA